MSPIQVRIRKTNRAELNSSIRFFWFGSGTLNNESGQYLLPMDHSDLIINVEGEITYCFPDDSVVPEAVSFHGIRKKPVQVVQECYSEILGISFEPWGLYPFINKNMDTFQGRVINLSEVNYELSQDIFNLVKVCREEAIEDRFEILTDRLEEVLLNRVVCSKTYLHAVEILKEFILGSSNHVSNFCKTHSVNQRTLQRYFNKYIGVSPKEFLKIEQFQDSSREMIYDEDVSINDLVFHGQYFDQSHLTKDFKLFSNHPPLAFKKDQPSLKSKINFKK